MSTQAQIIANRLNAQKSTGPKTPEGMAVASKNSLKHGFSARQAVISTENQAEFDLYRQQLLDELVPQAPMESILADRIVILSWQLKRSALIQTQTIDALNSPVPSSPLTELEKRFSLRIQQGSQENPNQPPPDLALGRMAIKDFSNKRVLERLLMYERRIENSLYKTLIELQRLNLIKNLNSSTETQLKQLAKYHGSL